jgi:hypothetical protein
MARGALDLEDCRIQETSAHGNAIRPPRGRRDHNNLPNQIHRGNAMVRSVANDTLGSEALERPVASARRTDISGVSPLLQAVRWNDSERIVAAAFSTPCNLL